MSKVGENIVICQWRADQLFAPAFAGLRQITDLRDPDKSRYFAITEFNNCLSFDHLSFDSTKYVKSISACSGNLSAIFTQERSFNYA